MSDGAGGSPESLEEGRGGSLSDLREHGQGHITRRRGVAAADTLLAPTMAFGASVVAHWRQVTVCLVYVTMMLFIISLVASGALDWGLVWWGFVGSILFFIAVWFARVVHAYTMRSNAARRRRQRIPRGALETRLQLRHPGVDLRRLRLLLVDRDFTGEDYQTLLDLDEDNEVPSTVGASEGEIRRNPSFLFREPAPDSVAKPKSCTICLYPFKPRERVRIIPCLHQFHTECIDPWLRQNAICPVCKFPAVG